MIKVVFYFSKKILLSSHNFTKKYKMHLFKFSWVFFFSLCVVKAVLNLFQINHNNQEKYTLMVSMCICYKIIFVKCLSIFVNTRCPEIMLHSLENCNKGNIKCNLLGFYFIAIPLITVQNLNQVCHKVSNTRYRERCDSD